MELVEKLSKLWGHNTFSEKQMTPRFIITVSHDIRWISVIRGGLDP